MFTLSFEHTHRVLLSRFTGAFTLDDIVQCDQAVMLILGREGPIRGIIDLTGVDAVELSHDQLVTRARQPAIVAGQARVFVVATPTALAFARSYAAVQRDFGTIGPQIVKTLPESFALLNLTNPSFEPIELPWRLS